MYLSVVEASSQRFRILLRLITRNVKQRMTKENMDPFAKRIPITQPASVHSGHCLCLQRSSRFG